MKSCWTVLIPGAQVCGPAAREDVPWPRAWHTSSLLLSTSTQVALQITQDISVLPHNGVFRNGRSTKQCLRKILPHNCSCTKYDKKIKFFMPLRYVCLLLKGVSHKIFDLWIFSWISFLQQQPCSISTKYEKIFCLKNYLIYLHNPTCNIVPFCLHTVLS
jgi:hypothetical protein